MPICYEISIDIVYDDPEQGSRETTLPRHIVVPEPLTPEQLLGIANDFWSLFERLQGDTFPEERRHYRRVGDFRVTSVYRC